MANGIGGWGSGAGNGGSSEWDRGFWRFVRYGVVIGSAMAFFFAWDGRLKKQEMANLEVARAIDSLTATVQKMAANMQTREEAARILRQTNRERAKMWRALGRADEYREIE
jgi:hypothetical protein